MYGYIGTVVFPYIVSMVFQWTETSIHYNYAGMHVHINVLFSVYTFTVVLCT